MALIQIPIPDDLEKQINSVAEDKVKFILDAVKDKLRQNNGNILKERLIEGYRQNHEENLSLVKEFEASDLENWDDY